jgi:CheY-like chemotaxis protein
MAQTTTGTRTILVVEDEPDIRQSLKMALEMEGYSVATAENGRVALDLLSRSAPPCLILIDLMMPVMNGWEMLRELRADATLASIPVVVVTAFADHPWGVDTAALLRKPVELDQLYACVERYC